MRMYDLLMKKRDGFALRAEEIHWMIKAYVDGRVPDYQMSAMLMAIFLKGMNDEELANLTMAMTQSGDTIDLSPIVGIKVDKHSTGGVGDKTTFIVGPMVAAAGGKVAKMSGRGLGHTGGTVDKMEAIPHIQSSLAKEEFFRIVNEVGLCVIGQSEGLAPADKMLYALRDVTATIESIPLIASSIMSKKLAAGSDAILLDVKVGSGAFMKDIKEAIALAEKMVAIGHYHGKETIALITDMNKPLGETIGNSLEMQEVVAVLKNEGPKDLRAEAVELAANMLYLSKLGTMEECYVKAERTLVDGSAFQKLCAMVEAQGGEVEVILHPEKFAISPCEVELIANESGYISFMDAQQCGLAAVLLGAGREVKQDAIDYGAGIRLFRKTGDKVEKGERLAILYAETEEKARKGLEALAKAVRISERPPLTIPMLYGRVTIEGTKLFTEV